MVRPSQTAAEEQYLCLSLGHELGPMPFDDLRMMAKKGELGLDDKVRREEETGWRPARGRRGAVSGI